ncbi:MAG TPA: hypothetical protein VLH94_02150 [Spirochaetia bacterium]|nr:hypothetical protein [Spirochaetia bacterium]
MEETQPTNLPNPIPSSSIDNNIDVIQMTPEPPPKKRALPRIIIGVIIFSILAGIGFLVWNYTIKNNQNPDLVFIAPKSVRPTTPLPTLTDNADTDNQEIKFEPNPYRNETDNFQINIPFDWEVDDSSTSGPTVIFSNPQTTLASNSAILTYIHVSVSRPSGQTLTGYVNEAKNGLKTAYQSYVIDDDRELIRQGVTYHLLSGSYTAKGIKMKNRNLFLIYNDRGYVISATTPESSWAKLELLINATLFSFKNI